MKPGFNENELLENLKHNKASAFDAIYLQFSKAIYVYLLHKLKDPDICNDVLQDIFVDLWEKRTELCIASSLSAYLYQAARFKIIDIYRKDVRYQKYLSELAGFIAIDAANITDRIDNRNKLKAIESSVNNLPEKMREIFIMSRFEHYSTRDIADRTNLSQQTVKNQISKALKILRIKHAPIDIVLFVISLTLLKK